MCRRTVWRLAACVVTMLLALWPAAASALNPPDTFQIVGVTTWRHYLETDDLLVVIRYNAPYASPPSADIDETIVARLMEGTTTHAASPPYAYYNQGYGYGVVTIYMSASEVSSAGITWGGTGYSVRLDGNPAQSWTSYPAVETSSLGWQGYTSHDDTSTYLAEHIMFIADDLEGRWAVTLTQTVAGGMVLSAAGETYFTNAFPQLRSAVTSVFSGSVSNPTFREESYTQSYASTLRSQVGWVDSGLNNLGSDFGMSRGFVGILMALVLTGVMLFASLRVTGRAEAGILLSVFLYIVMVRLGLLDLVVVAVLGMFAALLISWQLFFRTA